MTDGEKRRRGPVTAVFRKPGGDEPVREEQMLRALQSKMFKKSVEPIYLDRYELKEEIGAGGFGRVYAGHDPKLQRKVAIKLLKGRVSDEDSDEEQAQERLLIEAQSMARFSHPHVVAAYDVGTYTIDRDGERTGVFIVMEFIDGLTLTEWAEQAERSYKEILTVMADAGNGLAAAHAKGIVHRDFKPSNVMVPYQGKVRVLDFGLARAVDDTGPEAVIIADEPTGSSTLARNMSVNEDRSRLGVLVGTPAYMAPEQHLGQKSGPATDQFAFCVTLYELLYGTSPFAGDTVRERAHNVVNGLVQPPPEDCKAPQALFDPLVRGLSLVPEDRFPNMGDLLDTLDKVAGDIDLQRRRLRPSLERPFHASDTTDEEAQRIRECMSMPIPGIIQYYEITYPTAHSLGLMRAAMHELVKDRQEYAIVVDLSRAAPPRAEEDRRAIFSMFDDERLHNIVVYTASDAAVRAAAEFILTAAGVIEKVSFAETRKKAFEMAREKLFGTSADASESASKEAESKE